MQYPSQMTDSGAAWRLARNHAPVTEDQLSLALFDEIGCALIVCDGRAMIRFANHTAREELDTGQLLLQQDGMLYRAPEASGDLDAAIRAAALAGRRRLVRLDRGRDRVLASVLPLRLASTDCPLVLVMLGQREPCSELGLELLAHHYGLTLAERRVLAALMRQATPRQIAAEHDVAMSTVRTQITALRFKFGVRRIESLLLQLAAVPPLASALRGGAVRSAPAMEAAVV